MVGGGGGGGREGKFVPPPYTIYVCKSLDFEISYILVSFQQFTFKLGNFSNLEAFFPVGSTYFPYVLSMSKVE